MSEQPFNRRYQRKFVDPFDCRRRRAFADNAVQQTYEAVAELSAAVAAEQMSRDIAEFLVDPADWERQQRRRNAQAEGWVAGEPGE